MLVLLIRDIQHDDHSKVIWFCPHNVAVLSTLSSFLISQDLVPVHENWKSLLHVLDALLEKQYSKALDAKQM